MKLISRPLSLAERIVNVVCADLYSRSGGDTFFDNVDVHVRHNELIPELTAVVQRELNRTPVTRKSR